MDKIKIRTGANISNILQSTITYAQAFTELVKNSIQNGATMVNIQLNEKSVVVRDNDTPRAIVVQCALDDTTPRP